MSRHGLTAFILAMALAVHATAGVVGNPSLTAIIGATLVDVSHHGRAGRDVSDAVVVISGDRIIAAGPRQSTPIPRGAHLLERPGKFIIPGLVDGFTGLQNQAEANAELYEGVTTIVGSGDDRRGHLFEHANPSPHVYAMDSAGSTDDWSLLREQPEWSERLADHDHPHELTAAETRAQLEATSKRGTRAIWVGWNITATHAREIIAESHALGMVAYGEFIATPYASGIADGVDALLHMSRYELGMAPETLITPLAGAPYGKEAAAAYQWVDDLDPAAPQIARYGRTIADHDVALVPTFSLFYLALPDHRNLWREPAAAGLDPTMLFRPSDPRTGEATVPPERMETLRRNALHLWAINGVLFQQNPTYLAASGASALGALPGIALHVEMELLVRRGLTPREALAAATSNYADQFHWRELGAVEPDRRADLLVLDADPTRDIRNADRISDVILSGRLLDRAGLLVRREP
jgi:hypothetical protein